jgi:hypothetical protein
MEYFRYNDRTLINFLKEKLHIEIKLTQFNKIRSYVIFTIENLFSDKISILDVTAQLKYKNGNFTVHRKLYQLIF